MFKHKFLKIYTFCGLAWWEYEPGAKNRFYEKMESFKKKRHV